MNDSGLMVDWVTAVIPFKHPRINNGHVISVDSDGVEKWVAPIAKSFEGSFESAIHAKSNNLTECLTYGEHLYISGNPSKFLQGHNIVGSDNLNLLVEKAVEAICDAAGFSLDDITRARIRRGEYFIKRVDINGMFELPSLSDVRSWLDAASIKMRSRHGRATTKKGTVYFGQTSKRWAWKFYSKFDEILNAERGHRLPPYLYNSPLLAFCENKLRSELVLRAPAIRDITGEEKPLARDLLAVGLQSIFNDYLSRLDMTANVSIGDAQLAKLPNKVKATYLVWRQGFDVLSHVSKATFYRHRKDLMEFGVDITLPCEADTPAGYVVPLIRALEAKPSTIPQPLLQYIVH